MSITFTEENLILYIYGEANQVLEAEIRSALNIDKELQEQYLSILSVLSQLDPATFEPNDTSLKIIMEESRLFQQEKIQ